MTNQHPITPPPELVQQWAGESLVTQTLCTKAARWGFNQHAALNEAELQKARDEELDACCEWMAYNSPFCAYSDLLKDLRAARRPNSPSLKEQALEALDRMDRFPTAKDQSIIRRALESLPDEP